jgi:hypothetical protein
MRSVAFAFGAVIAVGVILGACNAVLGIDKAVEPDAGSPEAGSLEAGSLGIDAHVGVDAAEAVDARVGVDAGDGSTGGGTVVFDYHLDCDTYCRVMAADCTDTPGDIGKDNSEYISDAVCKAICAQFQVSDAGVDPDGAIDPNVDPSADPATAPTLNCRLWHGNFGALEKLPHMHCPHAGPLGGALCGSDPCVSFCNLETFFCSGDFSQYDGGSDCLNACHPDAGGYPGYTYRPGDTETPGVTQSISQHGTLNCRMYHLEAAIDPGNGAGSKATHCPHTSQLSSAEFCGAQ